jgi:hypothetical protein
MINLTTLPVELVQQIASHIPVSALLSLKLASRKFFVWLPSPPQGYTNMASECEKRAIRRYLMERRYSLDGRRKCIICDGIMPATFYKGRAEPICKWHEGWFGRIPNTRASPKEQDVEFASRQSPWRTLCGHCKQIRGWDDRRCLCDFSGGCDSCGSWMIECHPGSVVMPHIKCVE